jgi:hypothetical protein
MLRMAPPASRRPPPLPLRAGATERWEAGPLVVDSRLVLRLARYRAPDAVPAPIREAAEAMTARASALVAPRARLAPARASVTGRAVRLAEGPAFSGGAVSGLLEGCPLAVAFVLTLGPALEEEVAARTAARELLEAYFLDTAGWAAIETAVRRLRLELVARAGAAGWRVTHRLAPGYRDWPLEEQRALVGFVDPDRDLVRLSEHGVLTPFKSVSGLFGLAPREGA